MKMKRLLIFFCSPLFFSLTSLGTKTWRCENNRCIKDTTSNFEESISIRECKLRCLKYGGLWPRPTGLFHFKNHSQPVDLLMVKFYKHEYPPTIDALLNRAQDNFLNRIKHPEDIVNYSGIKVLYGVHIKLEIYDPSIQFFSTNADESYRLRISPPQSNSTTIQVEIKANTFFGLRHGLETLSQLIIYDDLHKVYKMIDEATIEDKPVFTHRGVILDTARSYIKVDNILMLLDTMAANKLNTFHWHITDSQSFPYVSKAYPQLSIAGAYSENEVYRQNDIEKIVRHAQSLGIRIIPEFDAPAHVGEGWNALGADLVTCFNWQPWMNYCAEPPCGQLDPTNEKIYEILGTLYKEYVQLFHSDLFHLGGDEVNINCWRETTRIKEWMTKNNYSQTDNGYLKLWGDYQEKVLRKLKLVKNDPHPQAILWTSTLTQPGNAEKYLKPEDYIIQIWTGQNDSTIKNLIEKQYRVIFSNYDELYFDCGGPSWVGRPGQNWCSPYIGWQYVYGHSPYQILQNHGIKISEETKKLILGSEAAIWTEQIDDHSLHLRLWPRAAAMGERLWSNPEEDWKDAQFRMNNHRERLARHSPAELLQPRWCYHNDGFCE